MFLNIPHREIRTEKSHKFIKKSRKRLLPSFFDGIPSPHGPKQRFGYFTSPAKRAGTGVSNRISCLVAGCTKWSVDA